MSIQSLSAASVLGKLSLSWSIHAAAKSLLVSVATDAEFTTNHRLFLIPPHITGLALDIGNPSSVGGFVRAGTAGVWYARVGGLMGDEHQGVVDWSGIQGPTLVVSGKPVPKEPECALRLLSTQAIKDGLRIHTDQRDGIYALLEYGTDRRFSASSSKTVYTLDVGHGYHDCIGLDEVNTYSVRVRTWGSRRAFTEDALKEVSQGLAVHGQQALKSGKPVDGGDLAATRAGVAVVTEARERGNMRFATSADYMRYLSAKAKTSEGKRAV